MSVAAVPNGSSSTFLSQGQAPPFVPPQSVYLPSMPFSDDFNRPPAFGPMPSFPQRSTQVPVTAPRAMRKSSYVAKPGSGLTAQQQYYRSAPWESLVSELLVLADPNHSGATTEGLIKHFRDEVMFARTSGNDNRDAAELDRALDRVEGFLKAISGAREMLRAESQVLDPTLMPYINIAVTACIKAVRKKLYQNTDYDENWVSPGRLKQKAHSARVEHDEKLKVQKEKEHATKFETAESLQAKAVIRDILAQTAEFYRTPSNDDIEGVQPTQPIEAGCLSKGRVSYGTLPKALQYGLRGTVVAGAGPKTPELGTLSFMWGGNAASPMITGVNPWVPSRIRYSINLANARSLVQSVSYREDGMERPVLLELEHYSTDGGKTWPRNPYATSPSIESEKLDYTNSLITKAKKESGFWGCGAFFSVKAPPTPAASAVP
jgi:hypothetical protein